jgi:hypothetical protein
MQGFRASEWGNEGFLKDDGKDGLRLFIVIFLVLGSQPV